MDKSKKGDTSAVAVAAERIEQARLERERHIEVTQERVEPIHEAEPIISTPDEEDFMEGLAIVTVEPEVASAASEGEAMLTPEQGKEAEGSGRGRRGRRGRRRGKGVEELPAEPGATVDEATIPSAIEAESVETPFVAGRTSFERIVDEDERAAEDGSMLKDAILQERLLDQIHAVEFDMEGVPTTEVGSLLSTGVAQGASFERIDDSDLASDLENRETAPVQQAVAAHVDTFIDEITEDVAGTQSFERVSDDEKGVEAGIAEVAEVSTPGKSRRGKRAAATTGTTPRRSSRARNTCFARANRRRSVRASRPSSAAASS